MTQPEEKEFILIAPLGFRAEIEEVPAPGRAPYAPGGPADPNDDSDDDTTNDSEDTEDWAGDDQSEEVTDGFTFPVKEDPVM